MREFRYYTVLPLSMDYPCLNRNVGLVYPCFKAALWWAGFYHLGQQRAHYRTIGSLAPLEQLISRGTQKWNALPTRVQHNFITGNYITRRNYSIGISGSKSQEICVSRWCTASATCVYLVNVVGSPDWYINRPGVFRNKFYSFFVSKLRYLLARANPPRTCT